MKIKIFLCKLCFDIKKKGNFISNCKNQCKNWVCYECINKDSILRYEYNIEDKIILCNVCSLQNVKISYVDDLLKLINELNLSDDNKKNKILKSIDMIKYYIIR